MSHLHRSLLKSQNMRLPNRGKATQTKDYSPLTWDKYFAECKDIKLNDNTFRVYLKGSEGPTLALLHGGGYSALTWALFAQEIVQKICCKILAIDIRGHGETHTTDDDNLAIENLTDDIINVINHICDENEPIVFIGHSMGGALAVHCAQNLQNSVGLVVIDVVEGTALESLASMQTFLRNRPSTFLNIEHAIQWCLRSGQTHNLESARISMPGQIRNINTGKLGASELSSFTTDCEKIKIDQGTIDKQMMGQTPTGIDVISEEAEENQIKANYESKLDKTDHGSTSEDQNMETNEKQIILNKRQLTVGLKETIELQGEESEISSNKKSLTIVDYQHQTLGIDESNYSLRNKPPAAGHESKIEPQTLSKLPVASTNDHTSHFQPPNAYAWRINLSKTEKFWRGWFQGLSELFLNAPIPKLLLLANIHGLDTALTVGQMQGKFQMQVLPKCGHAIHEDLPDKVADIIASYLIRQRLTTSISDFIPVLPGC